MSEKQHRWQEVQAFFLLIVQNVSNKHNILDIEV